MTPNLHDPKLKMKKPCKRNKKGFKKKRLIFFFNFHVIFLFSYFGRRQSCLFCFQNQQKQTWIKIYKGNLFDNKNTRRFFSQEKTLVSLVIHVVHCGTP